MRDNRIIGQLDLMSRIQMLITDNTFPSFLILVGPDGSGKKLVSNLIAKKLNAPAMVFGISVNDIRSMIQDCHKIHSCKVCILPDADGMSNEAKNAMLKIVEEPPKDTYFIMTLQDVNNTLPTIKSRAYILNMDRYTPDEITDYAVNEYDVAVKEHIKVFRNLCETPGEVNILSSTDVEQFIDYVSLVLDNIAEVGTANALKIGDKVALKDGTDGYDLKLFWKAFIDICLRRAQTGKIDSALQYASGASITSKFLSELKVRGVNKQMLFLDWVLRIRKEWN